MILGTIMATLKESLLMYNLAELLQNFSPFGTRAGYSNCIVTKRFLGKQKCLQTSSKTAGVVFTCCYMLGPIDFLTFFVVVVFLFVCLFV